MGTAKKIKFLLSLIIGILLAPISITSAESVPMSSVELNTTLDRTFLNLQYSDSVTFSLNPIENDGLAVTTSDVIATTNSPAGYTLQIQASEELAHKTLDASFAAAGGISTLADNTWGIKTSGNSNPITAYSVPAVMTTLDTTNSYNSPKADRPITGYNILGTDKDDLTPNTTTITYGAKADLSLPSGDYEGTIMLTAFANSVSFTYTLNFDANGGTGAPATQTFTEANITEHTFDLSGLAEPTRDGYTFVGWTDVPQSGTNANKETVYSVYSASYPASVSGDVTKPEKTLYALWAEDSPAVPGKMLIMQTASLSDFADGEEHYILDSRDGSIYTAQKIGDHVWMTQNLRFMGTQLNPTTTNVSKTTTMTYYDLEAEGAEGGKCYQGTGLNYACSKKSSTEKIGAWYNFASASALTVTGYTTVPPISDICPANWHLPSGPASTQGTDGYSLFQSTTHNAWIDANNYLNAFGPVTGGFYDGGIIARSDEGHWWLSSEDNYGRDYLRYKNGQFRDYYSANWAGLYIRCVMEDRTIADITYMQQINSKIVENTAELATTTLTDMRDNNTYTVKKINGLLWMTQNLRLTGTVAARYSNFIGNDINLSQYDLVTDGDSGEACNGDANYSALCTHDSGETTTGVWYNYAAATAGTIVGTSNTSVATSDICPSSWHIPTGPAHDPDSEWYRLFQDQQSGYTDNTEYIQDFNPSTGGEWVDGLRQNNGISYYWSATPYSTGSEVNGQYRYILYYSSHTNQLGAGQHTRARGDLIRCVSGG